METIHKCITIALGELGKLSFSGNSVIPAGQAMQALVLAAQEAERLLEEAEKAEAQEAEKAVDADAN